MQVSVSLGVLLLLVASCAARDIPSRAEIIDDYETVFPQVTQNGRRARNADENDDSELIVKIDRTNESLTFHLEKNDKLISPNFTSIYYDDDGNEITVNGHANCYYQGRVEEHPKWIVIMNTCGGLNGFFGDMNNKSEYFRLSPKTRSNNSLEQEHILVADTQSASETGTCGTEDHTDSETITEHLESLTTDIERFRRQSPTGDYIVEMAIVNDNRQYAHHGRDLTRTVQNALDVVNAADLIYRSLRVRLVVVHAITWTSGDRINVVPDPNTMLDNMRTYKRTVSQPHDAMMLLTGQDLTASTVGIAYLNTMCGSASVGVVQEAGRSTSSSGSTFAHELGHIFNLQHDTSGCSCNDRSGRCVMAAISGFPAPERWSSCSTSQLQTSLTRNSNNLGRCLGNEPLNTVGDPVCGNGIREGDEVCDCGSSEECDDPCCDARTCRPRAGAQCTRGECCTSTCQFKAYGTTCRSASGGCDIEEYCSGESSECPVDVYQQDGGSCNGNEAYCFSGECQTYNDQCQYHFDSNMGASECYTSYNPQGSVFGNCGHSSTDYIPCLQSDAMCGQLFCQPGEYQRRVTGVRVTIVTVGVFVGGQRQNCQGFTTQPGTDMLSPGLVSDGTRCGDGRLCYEQRCISMSALPGTSCPVVNGQTCSGRGACNNRGQCSCPVGFIGSACQTVNSGPLINECQTGEHNCDQGCIDTEESFFCTCNSGFKLASDGHSCEVDCGGRLTSSTGSFTSPDYPVSYPDNVECEWIIEVPDSSATIEFTIDETAFGINGRPPCGRDFIEFFDGTTSNAASLEKICGLTHLLTLRPITTTSSRARVVFSGSDLRRSASRVGVKVDYRALSSTQNGCEVNNGDCDHICVDTAQSFQCSCRTGYRLGSNGRSCLDINECSEGSDNCVHSCTNTVGSYTCSCNAGYRLDSNRRSCNDINECSEGSDNCDHRCTNTIGSFSCSCNTGYRLSNGRTCTDINECSEGTDRCDQRCTNTAGSYTCSCNDGFTLETDGRSCTANPTEAPCGGRLTTASGSFQTDGWPNNYRQEDFECEWIIDLPDNTATIEFTIDDSAYGINGRPPCTRDHIEFFDGTASNAASLEKICGHAGVINFDDHITTTSSEARVVFTGSRNSARPASRVGVRVFFRTIPQEQENVDECQDNNGGCSQVCVDTPQSFECRCNSGYTLNSDGRTCTDVNECLVNNGRCQQNCFNFRGSFTCLCDTGFRLASDRLTCTDINECSEGTNNCEHVCIDTDGSYTCACNSGFTLDSDGRSCTPNTEEPTTEEPTTEQPTEPDNNGCGGRLTAASGSFQTEGWPNSYLQEDFECEWIIDIPDDGSMIEFTVDDSAFGINGRLPCTDDYIEFFDGEETTARSLHKTCNYNIPPVLTTTSSTARVVFVGSANRNRPAGRVGVRVTYRTVEPSVSAGGCGGRLTGASGSFQTEGWPNSYRFEEFDCEWIIELPDSSATIEFTIDESAFGINGRPPCTRDHIEFFDGTSSNSQSLGKVCGLTHLVTLRPITTTSSTARVVFTGSLRSRSASRVGVRVTYRTV